MATTQTVGAVRNQLARVEEQEQALHKELQKAQREVVEARAAGAALLTAVEAAMAPLMQELAAARNTCGTADLTAALSGDGDQDESLGALRSSSAAGLEAEIRHLELDIGHYQEQAERLHAEERQSDHDVRRLQGEMSEATEHLAYQKQRARHFEMKKQMLPNQDGGWAGLGPSGIGRRTIEVRSEQQLREAAEKRAGSLARDMTRLALDTATQQNSIEGLAKRLVHVRKDTAQQDSRLQGAATTTSELHRRMRGEGHIVNQAAQAGKRPGKQKGSASTGKLPHLSF